MITFRQNKLATESSNGNTNASSSQCDLVDLDSEAAFYWDSIREKLEDSGSYALSISERLSNTKEPANLLCGICHVDFKNRKSLMRHMLRKHDPKRAQTKSKYKKPVKCLFCNIDIPPPAAKNLIVHYKNAHNQDLEIGTSTFQNARDFNDWRERIAGSAFR